MGLNIKNDEAHKLASEVAGIAGETLTQAVTVALRERLQRLHKKRRRASVEELLEIGRQCASHLHGQASSTDHGEFLYDDRGLPK